MATYLRAMVSDAQVVFEVRSVRSNMRCSRMFVRKPGNSCSLINMDSDFTVAPVPSSYWAEHECRLVDSSTLGGDERVCRLLGFKYPFLAEVLKYIDNARNPEFPARKVIHSLRNIGHADTVKV